MRVPVFIQAHKSLLLVLLMLILSVDGRTLPDQQASDTVAGKPLYKLHEIAEMGVEKKLMVRALIGSRPPRCEGKCIACGHCEPVQVPVVPEKRGVRKFKTAAYNGGDYGSNYKPMKWKCKCGSTIFNP